MTTVVTDDYQIILIDSNSQDNYFPTVNLLKKIKNFLDIIEPKDKNFNLTKGFNKE